jgi:hypothetical protein
MRGISVCSCRFTGENYVCFVCLCKWRYAWLRLYFESNGQGPVRGKGTKPNQHSFSHNHSPPPPICIQKKHLSPSPLQYDVGCKETVLKKSCFLFFRTRLLYFFLHVLSFSCFRILSPPSPFSPQSHLLVVTSIRIINPRTKTITKMVSVTGALALVSAGLYLDGRTRFSRDLSFGIPGLRTKLWCVSFFFLLLSVIHRLFPTRKDRQF